MKNSSDTIGNRTRDLPTCRALPLPTAPPRVHTCIYKTHKYVNVAVFAHKHVGQTSKD